MDLDPIPTYDPWAQSSIKSIDTSTELIQYIDLADISTLCSPETFDFIYPSKGHGKEE